MSISFHRANLSSRPAAALIYRIFASFPWLTHLSIDYAKCIFLNCQNAFPYSPPPHRLCGGEFKATSHLWNSVTETLFWKVHLHRRGNHNRIDHNTIPLLTNGWNRTSTCSGGAVAILFCHGSSLHQWWSPPQSPPATNLTAAFSFFFSTKKTATVGQIVRSGPYQCCSVHVNLQEGGSGNSKTRKKAETFHNSRSH